MCLMGNPTEKPLTLNKEERWQIVRGEEKEKRVGWVYGGKKVSKKPEGKAVNRQRKRERK